MEWIRGPTIGRGGTATVHVATATVSGEIFAVKSAELSLSTFLQNEQSLLSKLASPRIVKCLGFSITTETNTPMYNLFLEYAPKGTIFDKIRRHGKLDEPSIKLYTFQILQGLDYLHRNGVVHCDIKSRNVLIGEDGAKIADLGCAKSVFEDPKRSGFSGTAAFMAPEVARGERQGFEADVWALGCTVIEMASGGGPWPEMVGPAAMYRVGFSESLPEFPGGFSEEGKDFLSKCLVRDWRERASVGELLGHRFVQELGFGLSAEMGSPSSVLDKGLWEAMEARDRSFQELGFHGGSVSSSARERVGILVGAERFCDWGFGDDEDWLTIRGNGDCEDFRGFEAETSMALVDRDDEEEAFEFDGIRFGDELSFDDSVDVVSDVFSDRTFVMPSNDMDLLNEMNSETFFFDSISLFFFFFYLLEYNFFSSFHMISHPLQFF